MIYNFYIFDRKGSCIHYVEWNRTTAQVTSAEEEQKLMFGMLYSLKLFVKKSSPYP